MLPVASVQGGAHVSRGAVAMGEYLCIGDYLCLYCEETEGFVYSYQSSQPGESVTISHHIFNENLLQTPITASSMRICYNLPSHLSFNQDNLLQSPITPVIQPGESVTISHYTFNDLTRFLTAYRQLSGFITRLIIHAYYCVLEESDFEF
ncbi:hypothetical protein Btru_072538 [Bulinus truncatus]|nr:hypothetical protein Btru_072538 [Bulinus truncatus]